LSGRLQQWIMEVRRKVFSVILRVVPHAWRRKRSRKAGHARMHWLAATTLFVFRVDTGKSYVDFFFLLLMTKVQTKETCQ
jgi:hypothetical protein